LWYLHGRRAFLEYRAAFFEEKPEREEEESGK